MSLSPQIAHPTTPHSIDDDAVRNRTVVCRPRHPAPPSPHSRYPGLGTQSPRLYMPAPTSMASDTYTRRPMRWQCRPAWKCVAANTNHPDHAEMDVSPLHLLFLILGITPTIVLTHTEPHSIPPPCYTEPTWPVSNPQADPSHFRVDYIINSQTSALPLPFWQISVGSDYHFFELVKGWLHGSNIIWDHIEMSYFWSEFLNAWNHAEMPMSYKEGELR
jgi:hypothetical protein